MKKQVYLMILIVANLLFAQSLMAQPGTPEFSAVGGPVYSTIFGDSDSWKGSIGAQAGVIANILNLSNTMSVRVEINISLQGAKWEEDWGEGLTKGRTNMLYSNLPLVVRYQAENGFFGELGIQPGLLLSAKDKYEGTSYDYKEYMNKFHIGIPIGIGYEFQNNFGAGIRIIPGITNINGGDYSDYNDHSLIVALRVTYTFKNR
jgi:hypothetical protein